MAEETKDGRSTAAGKTEHGNARENELAPLGTVGTMDALPSHLMSPIPARAQVEPLLGTIDPMDTKTDSQMPSQPALRECEDMPKQLHAAAKFSPIEKVRKILAWIKSRLRDR